MTQLTALRRAAGAISDEMLDGWAEPGSEAWKKCERAAHAVLTAIRTPSEAMINAGAEIDQWVQCEGQDPQPEVYTAMIDAALAEEG